VKDLKLSNLPLRTKFMSIIVGTSILVVLTIFIATIFSINDLEIRYKNATFHGKEMLWEQITKQELNELRLGILHLQRNRELIQNLNDDNRNKISDMATSLYKRLSSGNKISDLYIANMSGQIIFSSSDHGSANMLNDKFVAGSITDGRIVSGIRRDEKHITASITFPLYARGKMVGVGIYEKNLQTALENFKANDGSDAYIVMENGKIEYGTNPELITSVTYEMSELVGSDNNQMKVISLNDKHYTLTRQPILDNDKNRIAYLVSLNDATTSYNERKQIEIITFSGIVAALIVSLLALFFFIQYTLHPLKSLMNTVKFFGKGETDRRVEVNSNDEIGQLGTAFNAMAQRIHDSIEHERQTAEDIEGKAALIHEVVEMASQGDLTGEMMVFRDKDVMSELSESVTDMITNLNSLVKQVQQSGIQVTSSATQIAATAKQQEATITEQAATTNEIVATTKQISSTSKELLHTMDNITKVSEQTASSAESGRNALSHMEGTMNHMVEASSTITSKLAVLNEKASNINAVVTTITKVADQTNLLSLNAAIEAEKAGEYGVGFSVVATEIRRLADQTAVATWDIEQMVQEMQSAVSAGVMGMDKFSDEIRKGVEDVRQVGAQLSEIIEKVQTILPQFEKVHEGMHSQTMGADQISESMIQLNEATQQTADSLRQSNDAIARLNDAAQGLQGGISRFKIKT